MPKNSTRSRAAQVVKIWDSRGYVVAGVRPDGTLQKDVSGSRHFLKKPPAIAFDALVLDRAEAEGATVAEVTDVENGSIYTASVATIRRDGFKIDRGYGAQIGLLLREWRRDGEPSSGASELPARQLALFR